MPDSNGDGNVVLVLEKPCPFCGGTYGDLGVHPKTKKMAVVCRSCAAEGPWARTQHGALREWNRRVP